MGAPVAAEAEEVASRVLRAADGVGRVGGRAGRAGQTTMGGMAISTLLNVTQTQDLVFPLSFSPLTSQHTAHSNTPHLSTNDEPHSAQHDSTQQHIEVTTNLRGQSLRCFGHGVHPNASGVLKLTSDVKSETSAASAMRTAGPCGLVDD